MLPLDHVAIHLLLPCCMCYLSHLDLIWHLISKCSMCVAPLPTPIAWHFISCYLDACGTQAHQDCIIEHPLRVRSLYTHDHIKILSILPLCMWSLYAMSCFVGSALNIAYFFSLWWLIACLLFNFVKCTKSHYLIFGEIFSSLHHLISRDALSVLRSSLICLHHFVVWSTEVSSLIYVTSSCDHQSYLLWYVSLHHVISRDIFSDPHHFIMQSSELSYLVNIVTFMELSHLIYITTSYGLWKYLIYDSLSCGLQSYFFFATVMLHIISRAILSDLQSCLI